MIHHCRTLILALTLLLPLLVTDHLNPPVRVAAQDAEPVTLDLWIFEGEEQLLPALEEAFESEHPNIDLEITLIPEDQYVVKIDTALAAGSPPDIGFLYEQRWVKTGNILPLGEIIAAHDIDTDDFNQAVMEGLVLRRGRGLLPGVVHRRHRASVQQSALRRGGRALPVDYGADDHR